MNDHNSSHHCLTECRASICEALFFNICCLVCLCVCVRSQCISREVIVEVTCVYKCPAFSKSRRASRKCLNVWCCFFYIILTKRRPSLFVDKTLSLVTPILTLLCQIALYPTYLCDIFLINNIYNQLYAIR